MPTITPKTIQRGDDLMLFDASGNSIAYATSHTLTLSGETASINSKDHGAWNGNKVNKLSWEISSENLYTTEEYNALFAMMVARNEVTVYFGLKASATGTPADGDIANWSKATSGAYTGKVVITSLTANAATGDNATFSVTLTGTGALTQVQ